MRLQKPKGEAEVYNNNKSVIGKKKNLKSLIKFHSTNKIDNYNRGVEGRKKKNPKETTE